MVFLRGSLGLITVCLSLIGSVASKAETPPGEAQRRDAQEIQALIDAAPEGGLVTPPAGHYHGRISITKPLILDGQGTVSIDGGGVGTVVHVKTNGATVRGLTLSGTGNDHNDEDSGIQVRGNNNIIKDNILTDVLFGIDLNQSDSNIVRRNTISSKDEDLGLRGDPIRLWYSSHNKVEQNTIDKARDFVLWYSKQNTIADNVVTNGRYGLHFMFSANNIIERNKFMHNSVGISSMYGEGDVFRNNVISHAVGSTGVCISMKEASGIVIENNDIVYCAVGIFLDVSPFQPDTVNLILNNRIAYHDTAISFLSDWKGNIFKGNRIQGNMTDVAVNGGGSAKRNDWDGNFWDSYEGFDRNGDGVGDLPYRPFNYAGRVWMESPNTRFFKGTVILEVLDFLDRLAPFSEPELLLEDPHPKILKGQGSMTLAGVQGAAPPPGRKPPLSLSSTPEAPR